MFTFLLNRHLSRCFGEQWLDCKRSIECNDKPEMVGFVKTKNQDFEDIRAMKDSEVPGLQNELTILRVMCM